jgi:hypothetical protein
VIVRCAKVKGGQVTEDWVIRGTERIAVGPITFHFCRRTDSLSRRNPLAD